MSNRKATEKYILKMVEKLLPGSRNTDLYRNKFKKMSDKEFAQWMDDLESGKVKLTVQVPPFSKSKLKISRNLAIAKELGISFHKKVRFVSRDGEEDYTTPIEFLTLRLPVRRTAQSVIKNISAPTDMKTVDKLSGRPTGASKGAAISYPELQLLPLNQTLVEFIKYRGGDSGAYQALMNDLLSTGKASAEHAEMFSTGVASKRVLKSYLAAAHIDNNL